MAEIPKKVLGIREKSFDVQQSKIHSFTLRLNSNVITLVDDAVSKHPVINNRNTWIANAIVEQLKREGLS
jgi:hypothetical protein